MSRVSGIIKCIQASKSLKSAEKDRLIEQVNEAEYDSATAKLIFSDEQVAEKLSAALKHELEAMKRAAYSKAKQLDRAVQMTEIVRRVREIYKTDRRVRRWFKDLLTADITGDVGRSGEMSIKHAGQAISRELQLELGPVAAKFGESFFGKMADPEGQKAFVRAVLNKDFGNSEWGELAEAMWKANEKGRLMYNDAGGTIAQRESYIFASTHNPQAILDNFGGFDGWADHIRKNFDFYNPHTGMPFEGEELDQAMRIIYDNIMTGRTDAPVVMYDVKMPGGSTKRYSAAIVEEKLSALNDKMRMKVDTDMADDLDMNIGKTKTAIKKAEDAGDDASKLKADLADLEQRRGSIISESEFQSLAKERDALKAAQDSPVAISGEMFGDMPLHKMRSMERSLVPKNPDAWIDYQSKMGVKDFFSKAVANLEQMGQEIALMKMFGPDVERGFDFMADNILAGAPDATIGQKMFGRGPKQIEGWQSTKGAWGTYLNVLTGEINKGGNYRAARMSGALRNVATGLRLAGATETVALGDLHTAWMTAGYAGTGRVASVFKQIGMWFQSRNAHTANIGAGVAHMANSLTSVNRYSEVADFAAAAGFADFMTRINAMQHLTNQADAVFPMRMNQLIAENIHKSWDDLPRAFRRGTFERFGVTKADWEDIQKAKSGVMYMDRSGALTPAKRGSSMFLDLTQLDRVLDPERATELRMKLMYISESMRDLAVMKSTVQAKAISGFGMNQSTWFGNAPRVLTQFLSFPISYLNTHFAIAIREAQQGRFSYGAQMFFTATMAGAMAIQADEVTKGRNPRPMGSADDPLMAAAFVRDSILKGGGLGFYGDMLMALAGGEKEAGAKLAGPGIGLLAGTIGDLSHSLHTMATEDAGKGMAQLIYAVSDLSPIRSLTGFSFLNQYLADWVASAADPHYVSDKQRRSRRYYEQEQGSSHWYDRRNPSDSELPDLTTAFGDGR